MNRRPVLSIMPLFFTSVPDIGESRFVRDWVTYIVDLQCREKATIVFDVSSTFDFDIDILNTLESLISKQTICTHAIFIALHRRRHDLRRKLRVYFSSQYDWSSGETQMNLYGNTTARARAANRMTVSSCLSVHGHRWNYLRLFPSPSDLHDVFELFESTLHQSVRILLLRLLNAFLLQIATRMYRSPTKSSPIYLVITDLAQRATKIRGIVLVPVQRQIVWNNGWWFSKVNKVHCTKEELSLLYSPSTTIIHSHRRQ